MYSQITHVGIFFLTVEALLFCVGLFYLLKSLHHASLMVKAAKPTNISGEFLAAFAFHKERSRHFMTLWMLFGMLVCLLGVTIFIADGMSLIHLTKEVPMGSNFSTLIG